MGLDAYNRVMDNTNGVSSYRSIHGSKILYAGETKDGSGIKSGYSFFWAILWEKYKRIRGLIAIFSINSG